MPPKRPYRDAALEVAAGCLKGFYLHQCAFGINLELRADLEQQRLPTKADRDRALLGHIMTSVEVNPLNRRRRGTRRRNPKMPPDDARALLLDAVITARTGWRSPG
jgi:hypothetical protein